MNGEVESLRKQLGQRRKNLSFLQEQIAMYAAGTEPLHLQNQIEAEKEEISRLEAELSAQGYSSTLEIDETIRAKRIAAYEDLWRRLKLLARYDRERQLTPAVVKEISESMMQWYFEVGGLYLSEESRVPYFALKEEMRQLVEERGYQPDELPRPEDETALIEKASRLRASLRRDVGT